MARHAHLFRLVSMVSARPLSSTTLVMPMSAAIVQGRPTNGQMVSTMAPNRWKLAAASDGLDETAESKSLGTMSPRCAPIHIAPCVMSVEC